MVIALGTRFASTRPRLVTWLALLGHRERGALVASVTVSADVTGQLEADEGAGKRAGVEARHPGERIRGGVAALHELEHRDALAFERRADRRRRRALRGARTEERVQHVPRRSDQVGA